MLPVRLYFIFLVGAVGIIGGAIYPYRYEDTDEDPEWMWFPDGDGNLHLIHLREDESEPGPRFSADKNVHFRLFTRLNLDNDQMLQHGNNSSIHTSNFNAATETFFICHGWYNDAQSPVNLLLRNAYLSAGNYNVIVVDWAVGAGANYFSARGHASTTGKRIGEFINFLVKQAKVSLKRVHLVGHSLGAHAVGFAGKTVVSGKVNTIVGLDPALPLYQWGNANGRIDASDAEYVEIIHTNGGKLGFWAPLGHADFYPNLGYVQPGCGFDLAGSCAHARSYYYYSESISLTDSFRARKCRDFNQLENEYCDEDGNVYFMGGKHNKKKEHGVFVLETAATAPFGLS